MTSFKITFINELSGFKEVIEIPDDSLQNQLKVGDRIHEINGKIVKPEGFDLIGKEGDKQKLIITQKESIL